MQRFLRPQIIVLFLAVTALAPGAHAGDINPEVWIGGGISYPDYRDVPEACLRGGVGAVFREHVTLGVSGQADADHYYYFVDGGLILPEVWYFVPYARYQFGRRDDISDNAMGWCFGMRLTGDSASLFVEAHEITEPQDNKGISVGVWF